MFEIVVISGKGGTGKTSLTAAFTAMASNHIICDLDVDAPDLHLLLKPSIETEEEFHSGHEARIDPTKCTGCAECVKRCRFGAILETGRGLVVDPLKCEGCKVCVHFCPAEAIEFPERFCGKYYLSQTRFGPMIHARLFPGEENSGRLVALLRQMARAESEAKGLDLIVCDGAPGIGCPVISSLTGTNLAVIVTEPTPSGRHDLERISDLCRHFRIPAVIIVNKYDLFREEADRIEALSRDRGMDVIARVPFDPAVVAGMVRGLVIGEENGGPAAEAIRSAWREIAARAGR